MAKSKTNLPVFSIVFRGLVILLIWAVGIGIFMLFAASKKDLESSGEKRENRRVLVFEAKQVPVRRQWTGYGTAAPVDSADVPARVTAVVAAIPDNVQAGESVKAGQLLVELDAVDYERQAAIAASRIKELEAQRKTLEVEQTRLTERVDIEREDVDLAETDLARERRLLKSSTGSQKNVDDATRLLIAAKRNLNTTRQALDRLAPQISQINAQIEAQQTTLKIANEDIKRTKITSPIDGVLQMVDVELGEEVRPGTRVARVVDLADVEIPLRLPASARTGIGVGDPVTINSTDRKQHICDTAVARIEPEDDPATRTMTVYVEIAQSEAADGFQKGGKLLAPGSFVAGTVTSHIEQKRWVVPRRAIRDERIFMIEDDTIRSRPATSLFSLEQSFEDEFGLIDDQWVVLRADDDFLLPGARVVVSAAASLLDGAKVTPVDVERAITRNGGPPTEEGTP